ncbi:hypothetical protein PR048_014784 [Dryococelus australis]|uniref:Uncharacterized protein n=1 Tax=Dryococelus australis TaxID=614101 RepID=A0ABQ9HF41_9NEOP|nr:hypothetical protein PR048_014784 [Dryococelus australis]
MTQNGHHYGGRAPESSRDLSPVPRSTGDSSPCSDIGEFLSCLIIYSPKFHHCKQTIAPFDHRGVTTDIGPQRPECEEVQHPAKWSSLGTIYRPIHHGRYSWLVARKLATHRERAEEAIRDASSTLSGSCAVQLGLATIAWYWHATSRAKDLPPRLLHPRDKSLRVPYTGVTQPYHLNGDVSLRTEKYQPAYTSLVDCLCLDIALVCRPSAHRLGKLHDEQTGKCGSHPQFVMLAPRALASSSLQRARAVILNRIDGVPCTNSENYSTCNSFLSARPPGLSATSVWRRSGHRGTYKPVANEGTGDCGGDERECTRAEGREVGGYCVLVRSERSRTFRAALRLRTAVTQGRSILQTHNSQNVGSKVRRRLRPMVHETRSGMDPRRKPATKVKKRGSDTGDTNTHAQCLIAPTRNACNCFRRDAVLCKLDLSSAELPIVLSSESNCEWSEERCETGTVRRHVRAPPPYPPVPADSWAGSRVAVWLYHFPRAAQPRASQQIKPLHWTRLSFGATVSERLACSPPTKAIRVQSPAGSLRIFACGNRAGRYDVGRRVFFGALPFPTPFHSGAAPYSPRSPTSALKTSMLRSDQISSLFSTHRRHWRHQHVLVPFTSQRLVTYSPASQGPFATDSSQSDTRLVPRASPSQSENEFAHVKVTATPFRFCILTCSEPFPFWATLKIEVLRPDEGDNRNEKAGGNGISPRKPVDEVTSSGTISTCENPGVSPPVIEPGSRKWEARSLNTTPPWPQACLEYLALATLPGEDDMFNRCVPYRCASENYLGIEKGKLLVPLADEDVLGCITYR